LTSFLCFNDERQKKLLSSNAVPTLESFVQPVPAANGISAKVAITTSSKDNNEIITSSKNNDTLQADSTTNSLHNVSDSNNSLSLLSSMSAESDTKSLQSFNEADNLLQNTTEDLGTELGTSSRVQELGTEQLSHMSEVNTNSGKPNNNKRFVCVFFNNVFLYIKKINKFL